MSDSNEVSTPGGRFLLGFALVVALVAGFTVLDAGQRESLEKIERDPAFAESALWDEELFEDEESFAVRDEVVRVDGQPFFRLRQGLSDRPDQFLKRIGRDESDRFWVYEEVQQPRQKPPEANRFFLKIGQRQFLQLTDRPPSEW